MLPFIHFRDGSTRNGRYGTTLPFRRNRLNGRSRLEPKFSVCLTGIETEPAKRDQHSRRISMTAPSHHVVTIQCAWKSSSKSTVTPR